MTSFYGLYGRAFEFGYKEPFDLPAMFVKNKDKVNMATPYNYVTTHDVVGGNSGSPMFNKNLEFVGIIFDSNIEALIWPYAYTDYKARTISTHAGAMMETLKNIYRMDWIVNELMGK
ncbi:MAG: S46 family peptidase [Elusimicrobia bacterium]|nr:S46 family peptidase [Elusimicrobiota bacterium]